MYLGSVVQENAGESWNRRLLDVADEVWEATIVSCDDKVPLNVMEEMLWRTLYIYILFCVLFMATRL